MRRSLLLSFFAIAGLAPGLAAAAAGSRARRKDPRLYGVWRSDKERTTNLWRYSKEPIPENRGKFEAIFGKLTWRITATRWDGEFEEQRYGGPYSVLASDQRSVVVLHPSVTPEEKAEVKQYFFEPSYLYVVSGYNIEFFKRVEA